MSTAAFTTQIGAAFNTAAAVTMKITGDCADGADTITQTLWLIEPK